MRSTWSFRLRGGESFEAAFPGLNPPQRHDGRLSVWVLLLTPKEAGAVIASAEQAGASVSSWCVENLPIPEGNPVLPTARCPLCFWFDGTGCGQVAWGPEGYQAAVEAHPKALEDAAECPLLT